MLQDIIQTVIEKATVLIQKCLKIMKIKQNSDIAKIKQMLMQFIRQSNMQSEIEIESLNSTSAF